MDTSFVQPQSNALWIITTARAELVQFLGLFIRKMDSFYFSGDPTEKEQKL